MSDQKYKGPFPPDNIPSPKGDEKPVSNPGKDSKSPSLAQDSTSVSRVGNNRPANYQTPRKPATQPAIVDSNEFYLIDWILDFLKLPAQVMKKINQGEYFTHSTVIGLTGTISIISTLVFLYGFSQLFGGVAQNIYGVNSVDIQFNKSVAVVAQLDAAFKNSSGIFLTVLALMIAVWSSFWVLRQFEEAFDTAWGNWTNQAFGMRFPSYWLVLSTVPIIFSVSFLSAIYLTFPPSGVRAGVLVHILGFGSQMGLSMIGCTIIYMVLDRGGLNMKSALVGSAWAAFGIEISKFVLLAIFSAGDIPAAKIIVGVTGVVAYTFLSSAWLLLGSQIAHFYQYKDLGNNDQYKRFESLEPRPTREIALACLLEITKRFENTDTQIGVDAGELAMIAQTPPKRAQHVINLLEKVGLVRLVTDGEKQEAVLTFSPEKLTLDDFLARIEQRGNSSGKMKNPKPLDNPVNMWFWAEYSDVLSNKFGHLTLHQLAEKTMDDVNFRNDKSKVA